MMTVKEMIKLQYNELKKRHLLDQKVSDAYLKGMYTHIDLTGGSTLICSTRIDIDNDLITTVKMEKREEL